MRFARSVLVRYSVPVFVLSALFVLLTHSASGAYPKPVGYVNDFAAVMSSDERSTLEGTLAEFARSSGYELAIATVNTTAPETPKSYAVHLFEEWKIGDKEKDTGVLLLLALDERRVEIETGYGAEPVLTDVAAGRILDRYVVPAFREGRWAEGLSAGAGAIMDLLTGKLSFSELTGDTSQLIGETGMTSEVDQGTEMSAGWGSVGAKLADNPLVVAAIVVIVLILLATPMGRQILLLLLIEGGRGGRRGGGGSRGGFGGFGGGRSGGGGAGRSF